MAHMVEQMMSYLETPWHKLGTIIQDKLTAMQSLNVAGLNWTVDLRPAYGLVGGLFQAIPNAQAVHRVNVDGQDVDTLAIVGNRYQHIQNTEIAEWCDALSAASDGRAYVETAGSLDGGRKVWFLMRHNSGNIKLPGDDSEIAKYLLVCSSHDGSMNLRLQLTPVRVVCNNTLSMALSSADATARKGKGDRLSNVINIRHTAGAKPRMDDAIQAIGDVDSYFDGFTKLADALTRTPLSRPQWEQMVKLLLPTKDEDKVPTKTKNQRDALSGLLDTTPGAQPGTAWGALQAVADYADHHAPTRGGSSEVERRADRQLGAVVELKQNALDLIVAATKEQWGSLQLAAIVDKTAGNSDLLADIISATKGN